MEEEMFNKKFLLVLTIFLIVLLTCGCTQRLGDLTFVSTKNINMNASHHVDTATQTVGEDAKYSILGFSTGIPNLKEAIDKAIENKNGAVGLANVKIRAGTWTAILFGKMWYEVEGNPIYEENK